MGKTNRGVGNEVAARARRSQEVAADDEYEREHRAWEARRVKEHEAAKIVSGLELNADSPGYVERKFRGVTECQMALRALTSILLSAKDKEGKEFELRIPDIKGGLSRSYPKSAILAAVRDTFSEEGLGEVASVHVKEANFVTYRGMQIRAVADDESVARFYFGDEDKDARENLKSGQIIKHHQGALK